jgi:hypothetical protein
LLMAMEICDELIPKPVARNDHDVCKFSIVPRQTKR